MGKNFNLINFYINLGVFVFFNFVMPWNFAYGLSKLFSDLDNVNNFIVFTFTHELLIAKLDKIFIFTNVSSHVATIEISKVSGNIRRHGTSISISTTHINAFVCMKLNVRERFGVRLHCIRHCRHQRFLSHIGSGRVFHSRRLWFGYVLHDRCQ